MIIKKSELLTVAVKKSQYPDTSVKEIAFVGRSNVGKSSLINFLLNRKNLARVSGNPGKTRTINFYGVNDSFRIVDLPGYGYAKVSKSVSQEFGPMMEDYLSNRENLVKVIQLVDVRHEPSVQDVQMYEWLRYYGLSGVVVATKADKVSRNQLFKNIAAIRRTLELQEDEVVLPVSAQNKTGIEAVYAVMDELLSEAREG